ncbi:MAG: uracil-DNA glycosylase [bacterium]
MSSRVYSFYKFFLAILFKLLYFISMGEYRNELSGIIGQVRNHLKAVLCDGTDHIPCPQDIFSSMPQSLEHLENRLRGCKRCTLSQSRSAILFGEGNSDAYLMCVGDMPEEEEGEANKLLTKIFEAIHLKRSNVYICNIIKCRIPSYRQPKEDEITACKGFLLKQIALIRPQIICALGSIAGQVLLKTGLPLSELRGKFHQLESFDNMYVMVTYHPRDLIEHPEKKIHAWEDMKMLRAHLKLLSHKT